MASMSPAVFGDQITMINSSNSYICVVKAWTRKLTSCEIKAHKVSLAHLWVLLTTWLTWVVEDISLLTVTLKSRVCGTMVVYYYWELTVGEVLCTSVQHRAFFNRYFWLAWLDWLRVGLLANFPFPLVYVVVLWSKLYHLSRHICAETWVTVPLIHSWLSRLTGCDDDIAPVDYVSGNGRHATGHSALHFFILWGSQNYRIHQTSNSISITTCMKCCWLTFWMNDGTKVSGFVRSVLTLF